MTPEEWLATQTPKTTEIPSSPEVASKLDPLVPEPKKASPEEWLASQEKPTEVEAVPPAIVASLPKAEDASFLSNYGKFLSVSTDVAKGKARSAVANAVDVVDLPLSAPAWVGGMAAGLVAANKHAYDAMTSGMTDRERPAGLHFGSALAVSEDVLHKFGNPLRKALTGIGAVPTAADGTPTSEVATVMEKIGEAFKLAGEKVEEFTGSAEAGKATEFGSQIVVPAAALKGASLAISGAKKTGAAIKEALVKDTQVKQADPKRIQPAESVADVIQRKYERDALDTKIKAAEELVGELPPVVEGVPKTSRTREDALAYTDKEGNVFVNESKAKADFDGGFSYIFDPKTPTGKQKAAVFEEIGVTKDTLTKAIPDVETYMTFLKAHEESHVRNGDRGAYPRTPEGKADLMHPDAIKIEARATLDALKAINKPTAKDVVVSDVFEALLKETTEHPATREGASRIIEKALDNITADTRLVDIFTKSIEHNVPDVATRSRMARAIEEHRRTDVLLTDAAKNEGLVGALKGMDRKLAKDKFDTPLAKETYQARRDKLAGAIDAIKKRGSEDIAIGEVARIKKYLADIGDKAKRAGLIDALRTNYIPHVLDFSKSKLGPKEQAALLDRIAAAPKDSKLVRDFTQERTFEFLRELEKVVEGTGVVVLTDVAQVVKAYGNSMQTAIIHKKMIDWLKTNKAPDGRPWMMLDGAEAKAAGYVSFEGKGTAPIREYRVHPDLVDSVGFMFRQHDPNVVVRTLGGISHLTKALNTVASLFHAKSLMEAGFLTDPALFMKEVFTGGSGMRTALKAFEHDGKNPVVDLLIREGGLMIKVEDVQRTIVADTGKFLDNLATQAVVKGKALESGKELQLVQHITEPLDRLVLQKLNTFTWDYMHTAQKLNVATHLFTKMKTRNPQLSDAAIAKEVGSYVNNTFGGLNWAQVANDMNSKFGRAVAMKMAGIAGREWAQIVMFAPDWTVSTLRAVTTALPKELVKPQNWQLREGIKGFINPKTQGDLARRYVVNTALAWVTILNAINLATSGQNIWDNKDPTRIQLADGTSMQGAKHSMEAAHWLMAPDKTLGNKLGFWPKALFVSTTGVAYPSPDAPKLKDTSLVGRAKAVATLGAPFAVSSVIQAPKGEGVKRAALSTLGLPIYGVSKEKMKASQREGRQEALQKKREKLIKERSK